MAYNIEAFFDQDKIIAKAHPILIPTLEALSLVAIIHFSLNQSGGTPSLAYSTNHFSYHP